MKMAYVIGLGLALIQCFGGNAFAAATHMGKINVDLTLVDARGKSDRIAHENAAFRLDWIHRKCEIKIKNDYAPCVLDTSHDLVNAKGELIMKAMPQAHFEASTVDALISMLGHQDKKASAVVDAALQETRSSRAAGFDLPFYTCGNALSGNPDCLKNGKDLLLYNAFKNQSYVLRQIEITSARLGGKKLVLSLKLYDIRAFGGAFNIIGNNGAGNFSTRP